MKEKHNTSHYSKIVSENLNLDSSLCYKILRECTGRMINIMKRGHNIHIEDCIDITVNKKARANYLKKAKENSTNKIPR